MKGLLNSCKNFGNGCFVAGTLVKTEDGYKNIEAGDRVYSRNMLTEEEGYREVEEVFVREAEEIVHLTIGNTYMDATTKFVCDVKLEAGTLLRTGEVNPLFGFDGGGQQYDLIINGKNVGTFTNERIIEP